MSSISIEFLGTGTSQGVPVVACECAVCSSTDPFDKRLRSSVLVKVEGRTILIDAGPDLRQQMLRSMVGSLDAVLLTHEHMDHVAGIDELRAFNFKQRKAMDIYANPATNNAVRRLFHYAFAEHRYPGVPELLLHDVHHEEFEAGGVEVTPVEVMHHQMPVLGFRIGGFAYVTDAKTISSSAYDRLGGLDVLVLNALRKKEHSSHLNLTEAIEVAKKVGARRTFFTHISHLMGRHADVSMELPAGVAIAFDGLKVDVKEVVQS